MVNNRMKSVLLVVLVFLSVFQTGRLWFDDFSGRNFFYRFVNAFWEQSNASPYDQVFLAKPGRIVVYFAEGEIEFTVLKNTRSEFDQFETVGEEIIKEVLQKGKHVGTYPLSDGQPESIQWKDLFQRKLVFFEYPFSVPFEAFNRELLGKQVSYGKEINVFDQIIIASSTELKSTVKSCYFIDSKEKHVYLIELEEKEIDKELNEQIEWLSNQKQLWQYSSSIKDGLSKFEGNIFLPLAIGNVDQTIFLKNPFQDGEKVNEIRLENFVNQFFKNYALKWERKKEDNTYIYGDDNIIIRYLPEGIIEYSNQNVDEKSKPMQLEQAYQVARNFLAMDHNLQLQEVYLADFQLEETEYVFYFDYRFSDFPYVLSDVMMQQLGIEHVITIKVQNNQVKNAKWFVREKDYMPIYQRQLNDTYIAASDRLAKEKLGEEEKNSKIQDLFLGYYQETLEQNPELVWRIKMNGKWYTEPVMN